MTLLRWVDDKKQATRVTAAQTTYTVQTTVHRCVNLLKFGNRYFTLEWQHTTKLYNTEKEKKVKQIME